MRRYFKEQADRIVDAADDFDQIDLSTIPLIFRPFDEAEILKPITHRHGLQLMIVGASSQLDLLDARKTAEIDPSDFAIDIPDAMLQRVLTSLEELESQAYWQAIQEETERRLATIIGEGVETGWSNWRISKEIRDQLGGFDARKRGMKIARTEATGALNAGHQAAYEELAADGLIESKQWLTIGDIAVRVEHEALSNAETPVGGGFDVGGTQAPYPGWRGLPARQRIHCRCTTASVIRS